ncbi:alpha-N-acetylgalactosaminide alpha-2,6-sialyltransferase 1-like isoform X1 [Xiphophorus hellerii]|uniref:alpha-N-acetylgalactosaminide alpha-2,6-sialyltransferase 1-like isoform X1 n=1 Tax=Xiphophorus hellerii TaxID=8084 RepID=UPI0013B36D56|nr:alpha-N-acetylgalactosaminide alpha-2,6-sialyltransferase 1-like isoform X1 [Xiphophorus hellerii]
MARQEVKLGFFVLVILFSIVLFIMSQGYLPSNIRYRWIAMSAVKHFKRLDSFYKNERLWQNEGNVTLLNATRDSLTMLEMDQMNKSRSEYPIPIIYKRYFKKLPQWTFEDIYNLDAPPRSTKCAQSLRNSKDEDFQKAFLPNIRMFLHKDNINMREWNRLSHFNNPFGFMDMAYEDVMPVLKLISKPKEPLLRPKPGGDGCIHCAVVGTAGILNGSKMGAEIDAHDYVFRMNGAVIEGYEEDVGNRTSVYVHTSFSISSSLYIFKKYGYKSAPHDEGIKYVMIPEGMRDYKWLKALIREDKESGKNSPRTYYSGQYNESRFYVLHQDFLRYVRNRFLKSNNLNRGYWAIVRPTNGAFAVFTALHACDTVSAYGFITEDYKKYSCYYAERHLKTNVIFYSNHDYIMEKNLWKRLHDKKIIKLYQRT